jgi:hypothetical protein
MAKGHNSPEQRAERKRTTQARGAFLRGWRNEYGITLKQLRAATKPKISITMLAHFERGTRNFSDRKWDVVMAGVNKLNAQWIERMTPEGSSALLVRPRSVGEELLRFAMQPAVTTANYTPEQLVSMVHERDSLLGVAHRTNLDLWDGLKKCEAQLGGKTDWLVEHLREHIAALEQQIAFAPNWQKEIGDLRRLVGLRTEAIVKTDQADAMHAKLQDRIDREKESDE